MILLVPKVILPKGFIVLSTYIVSSTVLHSVIAGGDKHSKRRVYEHPIRSILNFLSIDALNQRMLKEKKEMF